MKIVEAHLQSESRVEVPAYILTRVYRSTARKFLAASNFLEVLKTFPQADVSDSVGF